MPIMVRPTHNPAHRHIDSDSPPIRGRYHQPGYGHQHHNQQGGYQQQSQKRFYGDQRRFYNPHNNQQQQQQPQPRHSEMESQMQPPPAPQPQQPQQQPPQVQQVQVQHHPVPQPPPQQQQQAPPPPRQPYQVMPMPQGAAPPPGLDPSHMYILSGPYMKFDSRTQSYLPVFTAKPVPTGVTIIATPKLPPGMAQSNQLRQHHHQQQQQAPQLSPQMHCLAHSPSQSPPVPNSPFNPNAVPFFPPPQKQASLSGDESPGSPIPSLSSAPTTPSPPAMMCAAGHKQVPHFMYWSSQYPEGTLIPLRQPQPPVYFQQQPMPMMPVEAN